MKIIMKKEKYYHIIIKKKLNFLIKKKKRNLCIEVPWKNYQLKMMMIEKKVILMILKFQKKKVQLI